MMFCGEGRGADGDPDRRGHARRRGLCHRLLLPPWCRGAVGSASSCRPAHFRGRTSGGASRASQPCPGDWIVWRGGQQGRPSAAYDRSRVCRGEVPRPGNWTTDGIPATRPDGWRSSPARTQGSACRRRRPCAPRAHRLRLSKRRQGGRRMLMPGSHETRRLDRRPRTRSGHSPTACATGASNLLINNARIGGGEADVGTGPGTDSRQRPGPFPADQPVAARDRSVVDLVSPDAQAGWPRPRRSRLERRRYTA